MIDGPTFHFSTRPINKEVVWTSEVSCVIYLPHKKYNSISGKVNERLFALEPVRILLVRVADLHDAADAAADL